MERFRISAPGTGVVEYKAAEPGRDRRQGVPRVLREGEGLRLQSAGVWER